MAPIKAGDAKLPVIQQDEFYKYLGIDFGAFDISGRPAQVLGRGLGEIGKAPLKPGQRLYILTNSLIPKLNHLGSLSRINRPTLLRMDLNIRKRVRDWLKLPADTPWEYFHAPLQSGGMGIPMLSNVIPLMKRKRLGKLHKSPDPVVKAILSCKTFLKDLSDCDKHLKVNKRNQIIN